MARRHKNEISILDFVTEDAESLRNQLGARDRLKMDEYFQAVREIEARLKKYETENKQTALAGKMPPVGMPKDRGEHIRLMGDMMVLALQTDMTRVATFMLANEGSNRPYLEVGIQDGHHDISHHGKDPDKLEKKRQIDLFHTQQLAYVLKKMKATEDGNGSLLDNTMLLYGGGISDGNKHNHENLPILLAGRAGGSIDTGRLVRYPRETPLCNLYTAMLERMGCRAGAFGDASGPLAGLAAG